MIEFDLILSRLSTGHLVWLKKEQLYYTQPAHLGYYQSEVSAKTSRRCRPQHLDRKYPLGPPKLRFLELAG